MKTVFSFLCLVLIIFGIVNFFGWLVATIVSIPWWVWLIAVVIVCLAELD